MGAFQDPPVASTSIPVAAKDVAESFGESDVSVTHSNTVVTSGSVRLAASETTPVRVDSDYSATDYAGVEILANEDITRLEMVPGPSASGYDTVRIKRASDRGTVWSDTVSAGETVMASGFTLSSGSKYHVEAAVSGGGSFTVDSESRSFPLSSPAYDVENAMGEPSGSAYTWAALRANHETSGSVTVEWPTPSDIYAWDVAQYQETANGETVTVAIEEDQAGGWTEIQTDIDRGARITADAANNLRYRIDLSRASTSNNPTIDALYRRYKL